MSQICFANQLWVNNEISWVNAQAVSSRLLPFSGHIFGASLMCDLPKKYDLPLSNI